MSAGRLDGTPKSVHRFNVLTQSETDTDLMTHALLCNESDERQVCSDDRIRVVHMGPPLLTDKEEVHAFGDANLSDVQSRKIKTFLDSRMLERKAEKKRCQLAGTDYRKAQYCIHPESMKPDRHTPFWRFSCVGFVTEAYEAARIVLLDKARPLMTLDDLRVMFPGRDDTFDDPKERKRLGIDEGSPWPIALAGYLMNAMNRPISEINGPNAKPYRPVVGDEYFPTRSLANRQNVSTPGATLKRLLSRKLSNIRGSMTRYQKKRRRKPR